MERVAKEEELFPSEEILKVGFPGGKKNVIFEFLFGVEFLAKFKIEFFWASWTIVSEEKLGELDETGGVNVAMGEGWYKCFTLLK